MYTPTMPQNLLIIGATGVIGTYITEAIVNNKSEFGRICVYTSKKTVVEKVREIAALESYGAEVFVGNLEDEATIKEAYRGTTVSWLSAAYAHHTLQASTR
jgi:FlaA1/EpsC-like NDP-sugar epimerase